MYSPIIIFAYNRLNHLQKCISSLLANELSSESDVFIYSDGPKNGDDASDVLAVRNYIHDIQGFHSINVIEREANVGLAENVIAGVTDIVNRYGKVIVIEDDLVLAPHFLEFMNDALDIYEDEEKVGHIQACDFTRNPELPDTFLIKWTGSWGWATWKRAWDHFNADGSSLLKEILDKKLNKEFDFNGKYGFTRMLRNQIRGKNNSWAIRWNASLFLDDILSLNVGKSLVANQGFDGSGTNCGGGDLFQSDLFQDRIHVEKIYPLEENVNARKAFEAYYGQVNSFSAKVKRRLTRMLHFDFTK